MEDSWKGREGQARGGLQDNGDGFAMQRTTLAGALRADAKISKLAHPLAIGTLATWETSLYAWAADRWPNCLASRHAGYLEVWAQVASHTEIVVGHHYCSTRVTAAGAAVLQDVLGEQPLSDTSLRVQEKNENLLARCEKQFGSMQVILDRLMERKGHCRCDECIKRRQQIEVQADADRLAAKKKQDAKYRRRFAVRLPRLVHAGQQVSVQVPVLGAVANLPGAGSVLTFTIDEDMLQQLTEEQEKANALFSATKIGDGGGRVVWAFAPDISPEGLQEAARVKAATKARAAAELAQAALRAIADTSRFATGIAADESSIQESAHASEGSNNKGTENTGASGASGAGGASSASSASSAGRASGARAASSSRPTKRNYRFMSE